MANTAKQKPAPFGALLLRLRAAAGLTQEQLAARAGLSPAGISALESGKRRTPRFATVELLAAALALDAQARHELVAAARSTADGAGGAVTAGRAPTMAGAEPGTHGTGCHGGTTRDPRRQSWRSAADPTPLVGREHELDLIVRSLVAGDTRLLTLVGPAGVGKTRLALAAATRLAGDAPEGSDRFPDGVTLVDLTPVRDPDLVPGAIARALGLLDVGGRPTMERLAEALAERRQVVVLDNIEQVLPAAALPVADLVVTCPHLALLVTSRVPLRLRWEQTLRVAPLPVPDPTVPLPPLDALLAVPSVALFVSRARARRADFVLRERDTQLVAQLVTQLDGLPLALELAAARLDVLPLPTLARRLGDRLQLLASEAPDRPERQRSLEAAVGWSYDLLTETERRLFRCLGVFVGRVSLDAIDSVGGAVAAAGGAAGDGETPEGRDRGHTLQGLLSLAEKSLVLPWSSRPEEPGEPTEADEDEDSEPAFGMLETVRDYARERLAAAGELEAASRAHAHYFLALAERADPLLRGRDQRAWYPRLEREHDNLRAALRWLLDQDGPEGSDASAEREAGLRLAGALGWFWSVRGYHPEGRRWLEEALARAPAAGDGEGAAAAACTRALLFTGAILTIQGDLARAWAPLEAAAALAERRRDPAATAQAQAFLGMRAVLAGDAAEATRLLGEAQRRWEALGDPHGLGHTLYFLGHAAAMVRDAAGAEALYTAALQQFDAAGDAHLAGHVRRNLGIRAWERGAAHQAVTQIQAAVRTSVALRDRWLLAIGVQAAVALVGAGAQFAARARLLGAADALAQATGAAFLPEQLPVGLGVAGLREQFTREVEWDLAYRQGRALPFGEVAALTLTLLEEVVQALPDQQSAPATTRSPERPSQHPSSLTSREQEVLRLVAQGLSSKAIAGQLFLAPSTVNYHLSSVFNKLGVDTRAQAVAVAARRGLV
jgi:predicted ATPase/DNA-binding CsgD family transcriptional regulator/DNA-binding XRE family transcriptional regulator